MSVQTAELRFEPHLDDPVLFLSCSLVNIARGSCQLTLMATTPPPSAACGELVISADRPVMKAHAAIRADDFDRLSAVLAQPAAPRPPILVISLINPVTVNMQGILFINSDTDIPIAEMNTLVPLK